MRRFLRVPFVQNTKKHTLDNAHLLAVRIIAQEATNPLLEIIRHAAHTGVAANGLAENGKIVASNLSHARLRQKRRGA